MSTNFPLGNKELLCETCLRWTKGTSFSAICVKIAHEFNMKTINWQSGVLEPVLNYYAEQLELVLYCMNAVTQGLNNLKKQLTLGEIVLFNLNFKYSLSLKCKRDFTTNLE